MSRCLDYLYYMLWFVKETIILRFKLFATNQQPILIYQMGKVGSISVYKSLEKKAILPLFHFHDLFKNDDSRSFCHFKDYGTLELKQTILDKYKVKKGAFLYNKIIVPKKQVKIISLTREPIGRNIAAFFQNFERMTGKKYELSNFSCQDLMDKFIKFYPHSVPLEWFDNQFKSLLGIDVYEYPFPKEEGYLRIIKDNVDLLIIKLETSDSVKEKAIKEFLGLKEFKLVRANVGEEKNYQDMYKEFKQNIKLPQSLVDEMCGSKYFNHFYTDVEISKVYSRWT